MERRPNSKVPYVHSLSVQNQPVSNAGSSCFSLPCPDPWPPLNPDPERVTWQTIQTCRLSWQTQTRFSPQIITDPEAPLQKCSEQVWLSVISSSSRLLLAPVSCVIFQKIRWERVLLQIKERWDKGQTAMPNPIPKPKIWQVPEIGFSSCLACRKLIATSEISCDNVKHVFSWSVLINSCLINCLQLTSGTFYWTFLDMGTITEPNRIHLVTAVFCCHKFITFIWQRHCRCVSCVTSIAILQLAFTA